MYKVDRSSGKIMWRLGGKRSDFKIDRAATFQWQHHAVWHGTSAMTLHDNAGASRGLPSRGLLLAVDEQSMRQLEWCHGGRDLEDSRGCTQDVACPDRRAGLGWV